MRHNLRMFHSDGGYRMVITFFYLSMFIMFLIKNKNLKKLKDYDVASACNGLITSVLGHRAHCSPAGKLKDRGQNAKPI